ncbi:MAG: DUF1819 family protein [Anaerolineae bacterium]|nr:DUF1819 family protein [Anaerolineae bacterium]
MKQADFDAFYGSKRIIHEELDETPDSTRLKVRQILFRMLREVGLPSRDHNIRILTPNAETVALQGMMYHSCQLSTELTSRDYCTNNAH